MATASTTRAEKVFGIFELAEAILINLDEGDKKQPVTQLFTLQSVNSTFKSTIEKSKPLRELMWLEHSEPSPVGLDDLGNQRSELSYFAGVYWYLCQRSKEPHLTCHFLGSAALSFEGARIVGKATWLRDRLGPKDDFPGNHVDDGLSEGKLFEPIGVTPSWTAIKASPFSNAEVTVDLRICADRNHAEKEYGDYAHLAFYVERVTVPAGGNLGEALKLFREVTGRSLKEHRKLIAEAAEAAIEWTDEWD